MNISWDAAQLFLAVAETGSFSAAAERLRVGQPTVSRRIAELEQQLGWALFHRGRRGARLTPEGERLVPAAAQMARWAAELERGIAGQEQTPVGKLRIAAPPGVAYDILVRFCAELCVRFPEIQIELLASIAHLDLTRGEADLAIRTRAPAEPELVRLATFSSGTGAFATEEYIRTLPACPRVDQIAWITWSYPYEHLTPRPELERLIRDFRPSFASDNFLIQQRACELGLGAMFLADVKHPLLRRMGLRRIELDLPLPSSSMHLVTAKSSRLIPRVRAVADALAAELAKLEPGDGRL